MNHPSQLDASQEEGPILQIVEWIFTTIVSAGMIITCLAVTPLLVAVFAWKKSLKRG